MYTNWDMGDLYTGDLNTNLRSEYKNCMWVSRNVLGEMSTNLGMGDLYTGDLNTNNVCGSQFWKSELKTTVPAIFFEKAPIDEVYSIMA